MKLKNKLLPLVGVATACAAVAPIALTSCTNDSIAGTDLTKWFTPTITRHEQDIVPKATAIEWYFGSDDENTWVTDTTNIIQDMQWSTSMMLNIANSSSGTELVRDDAKSFVVKPTTEKELKEPEEANKISNATNDESKKVNVDLDYSYYNVKLNSISFGTVYDYTETTKYPTLSYSFDYDYQYDSNANSNLVKNTSGTTEGLWQFKGTFTVSNLPVTLVYDDTLGTGDSMFTVVPDSIFVQESKNNNSKFLQFTINDSYSFDGTVTSTTSGLTSIEQQNGTTSVTYNEGDDLDVLMPYLYDCPVTFVSYYLYCVGCSDVK